MDIATIMLEDTPLEGMPIIGDVVVGPSLEVRLLELDAEAAYYGLNEASLVGLREVLRADPDACIKELVATAHAKQSEYVLNDKVKTALEELDIRATRTLTSARDELATKLSEREIYVRNLTKDLDHAYADLRDSRTKYTLAKERIVRGTKYVERATDLVRAMLNINMFSGTEVCVTTTGLMLVTKDLTMVDNRPDLGIHRIVCVGRYAVHIGLENFRVRVMPYSSNIVAPYTLTVGTVDEDDPDDKYTNTRIYIGDGECNFNDPDMYSTDIDIVSAHVSDGYVCWGSASNRYNNITGTNIIIGEVGAQVLSLLRSLEGILTTYNPDSPYVTMNVMHEWRGVMDIVTTHSVEDIRASCKAHPDTPLTNNLLKIRGIRG